MAPKVYRCMLRNRVIEEYFKLVAIWFWLPCHLLQAKLTRGISSSHSSKTAREGTSRAQEERHLLCM